MSIPRIPAKSGLVIDIATTARSEYHSPPRYQPKLGNHTHRDQTSLGPSRTVANHPKSLPNVTFQVARCHQERRSAFALVYRRYREAGLIEANPFRIRVTPFHLESTTTVMIGHTHHETYCTVTLVGDGCLGLPMETIFPAEIEQKRSEGLSLAEVSCLAFRSGLSRSESWSLFLGLNRLMAQFARRMGVDALVIATHPRHAPIYQRTMGFVQIGSLRTYPSVRNNPAVACCLNFEDVDRNHPPTWEAIFGQPVPAWQLEPAPAATIAEHCQLQEVADSVENVFLPLAVA